MPRNLTALVISETEKSVLRPALLIEARFTSGYLRLWTGVGNVVVDGETYSGAGRMLSIEPVIETTSVEAAPLKITLSGIPADLLAQSLEEVRQGAPARIKQAFVDQNGAIISSPYTAWEGKIGACVIDESAETAAIGVTVENSLVNLRRGPVGAQNQVTILSSMLSASGIASFSAEDSVDNDLLSEAWSADSCTSGSYVDIDLGYGNEKAFRRIRLYSLGADHSGVYNVICTDDHSSLSWHGAAVNIAPDRIGWNDFELAPDAERRYWRILLENSPGAGPTPSISELQFWESDIDTDTLIAAANICDETVELSSDDSPLSSEARYEINGSFTLDDVPADVIPRMNSAIAGSVVFAGSKWGIYPAVWRDASLSLTDDDLLKPISVQVRRESRDIFNSVRGVFISPDHDWQPTDFPPFSETEWIEEDQFERIWTDLEYPFTISPATAQRLSKIALRRNRKQVAFQGRFKLKAWQVQPTDVVEFSHPRFNWVNKSFEVSESRLAYDEDATGSALVVGVDLTLVESDSTVYDWSADDENQINALPEVSLPVAGFVEPPTSLSTSSISRKTNGVIVAGIELSWTSPNDATVTDGGKIVVQFKRSADSSWQDRGFVKGDIEFSDIFPLIDGTSYDFRIWAENIDGARSSVAVTTATPTTDIHGGAAYTLLDNYLIGHDAGGSPASATIEVQSQDSPIGGPAMIIQGVGEIDYDIGSIPGLDYETRYHVYFSDPTLSGGTVTYVASENKNDIYTSSGLFYLGSCITPKMGGPDTYGDNNGGTGSQSGDIFISSAAAIDQFQAGNGVLGNIDRSNDNDPTTWAEFSVTGNGGANISGAQLKGFSLPQLPWKSAMLEMETEITNFTISGVGDIAVRLHYSLDGGISFINVYNAMDILPRTKYEIPLSTTQNLSRIIVEVGVRSTAAQASGISVQRVYGVRIVAVKR